MHANQLQNALVIFETMRGNERRRYRVDTTSDGTIVRELMPQHVASFNDGHLFEIGYWSTPFREPGPILSIALRALALVLQPAFDPRPDMNYAPKVLVGSEMNGDPPPSFTLLDLGTFEMDAVKPVDPP